LISITGSLMISTTRNSYCRMAYPWQLYTTPTHNTVIWQRPGIHGMENILKPRFLGLLYGLKTIIEIWQCFGGRLKYKTKFHYVTGSSKLKELSHSNFTPGLMNALLLYTNSSHRIKLFTKDDLVFANAVPNNTMMGLLSYLVPSSDQLTNSWWTVPFRKSIQ
jgi:hypothetical protein